MKRLLVILILLFISPFLQAQEDDFYSSEPDTDGWKLESTEDGDELQILPNQKKKRLKNRTVELSIANFSFSAAQNFISAADTFRDPFYMLFNIKNIIQDNSLIWRDPVVVDLDAFFDGFKFNFDTYIKPLSLNFNWKDKWGFGLDIGHIDVVSNVSVSKEMLGLNEASGKFGMGGAIFTDVGIPFFFHADKLKIKIRPSAYLPLIYTEPGITYTGKDGTYFRIDYDMCIYTPVALGGDKLDMDGMQQDLQNNIGNILSNNLGYDFGLNVEYPWDKYLDIGVDIVNIPIPYANASLNHYMQIKGEAWFNSDKLDLSELINDEKSFDDVFMDTYDYPKNFEITYDGYNPKGKAIYRPFKMLFYANYRPFTSPVFSLIPSLGFSISRLYPELGSIEGGLSARWDHRNITITTLGINYTNRRWINSVDFILNLRAFEFDFGLSTQSQDFVKCWQGAGLGINFGLKFGW